MVDTAPPNPDSETKEAFKARLLDTSPRYAEPLTAKYVKASALFFHKDKVKTGDLIIKELGDTIVKLDKFIHFRDSDELYRFNGEVYEENANQYVYEVCNHVLGEEFTQHRANEAVSYIKSLSDGAIDHFAKHLSIETPLELVPFENGVYNLALGALLPYDVTNPFFSKIPVKFDASADCPRFKQFLDEVIREDDKTVLQEFIGYCLYRSYPFAKALLAVGSGRNGKTVLLNVIDSLLGPENLSHVSLQALGSNRFAKAELFGKYANTYADLPDKAVEATGDFKILTGNDPIAAEKKNKNFFSFRNHAKLIFSCNKIPESYDETDAYYERFIIVSFPNQFLGDKADERLIDTLKLELPGILNYALAGLHRLLQQHKFSYNKTLEETRRYYKRQSSTVAAYVEDCLEIAAEGIIKKQELYNDYVAYCRRFKLIALHRDVFFKKLPHEIEVNDTRIGSEKDRPRALAGIRFKNAEEGEAKGERIEDYLEGETSTGSQPVQPPSPNENVQPVQPVHPLRVPSSKYPTNRPFESTTASEVQVPEMGGQAGQGGQTAEGEEKTGKRILLSIPHPRCEKHGFLKAEVEATDDLTQAMCSACTKVETITRGPNGWIVVKLENHNSH